MTIAVIGGLAAGPAAAAEAKRRAPDAEVILFEQGPHVSVGTCEMPYRIGGVVDDDLEVYTPESLAAKKGITVHIRHRVTALDPKGSLTVESLDFGSTREVRFDRAILATGARARTLPGDPPAGVFTVRDLVDTEHIERWLATEPVRHVVVVGGGYIGVEMAEAMRERGVRASILDPSGRVLNATVACEASDLMTQAVHAAGVAVRAERATDLLADDAGRVRAVRTDRGELIGCQMVIVSIGVEPRTELVQAAGIRLGPMGGIAVDDQMRTSARRVYACGDAVEVPRAPDGKRILWPLATTARRTARVAARNAVKPGSDMFQPIAGAVAVRAFGIEVGSVGLSLARAVEAGLDAVAADIRHSSRTRVFPGASPIDVRLVVERRTGRILGGQLVGAEGAALRANVLVPLIQSGGTARQLAEDLDLIYNPPLAPAVDPLKVAASRAMDLV
ncbi:FAD-dependent oxidoreductase [Rubrivirga sp. IMCC43871]|uniref:FAD-dependent oxidoreductase n=1 Tax=Rubrivirga sp. IMCC43871 TaxID=3391575 RepID=UPI00398FD063